MKRLAVSLLSAAMLAHAAAPPNADLNALLDTARAQWGVYRDATIAWDDTMNSCSTAHGANPVSAITEMSGSTLIVDGNPTTTTRTWKIHVNPHCAWGVFPFRTSLQAVVLHEYGHVLGLEHSPNRRDIMYYLVIGKQSITEADRAGIAVLQASK